ncbi:MAG: FGGY family carbohydrate kinase [Spirochaetia bacterium]
MSEPLVLGLEFSTQSAKAVALGVESGIRVAVYQLSYDESFPHYRTTGGVLPGQHPEVRHTSPAMLLEALDELFRRMRADGLDLAQVRALKLDAQQHCTVYADESITERLAGLSATEPLTEQLTAAFTRATAPIWEDRSTEREARLLEERLAGYGGIQKLTANRAELRFPASQILKWARQDPAAYDRSAHIMLLSAFLTSVLTGRPAPADTGDGWGTNLNCTNISEPGWDETVLAVMDEEIRAADATSTLQEKLGEMRHYDTPVGIVSPYFAKVYGLNADAVVLAGTGDNPATLLGCGGNLVISLGSSYTVNGILADLAHLEDAEYNVFGYVPHHAMALSVITNGTKVHDEFRRRYSHDGSWENYATLAGPRAVTPEDPLLLPYLQEESVPLRPAGIMRDGFGEDEAMLNVRGLHLSQALSLRLHASHVTDPESLAVVGGGSFNERLRTFITDAFGAQTYRIRDGEYAAPLGCAVAAARYVLDTDYEEAVTRFVQAEEDSRLEPRADYGGIYEKLLTRYADLEAGTG